MGKRRRRRKRHRPSQTALSSGAASVRTLRVRGRWLKAWWRKVPLAVKLGSGFLTLLGGFTAYLSLLPDISIELQQPLTPDAPLRAPYVVTNEGPLALRKVRVACYLEIAEYPGITYVNTFLSDAEFGTLDRNESASVPCGEWKITHAVGKRPPWTPKTEFYTRGFYARVSIAVSYVPSLLPDFLRQYQVARFGTTDESFGPYRWVPQRNDYPVVLTAQEIFRRQQIIVTNDTIGNEALLPGYWADDAVIIVEPTIPESSAAAPPYD